jgi:hypothetical protein
VLIAKLLPRKRQQLLHPNSSALLLQLSITHLLGAAEWHIVLEGKPDFGRAQSIPQWGDIATKPSFGQSVVNVGFRMNWPFAGLPRSARRRASLHGSDFAGIGSHAKIVAAAFLTKNPTSKVVAHFPNPTGYLAQ